MLRRYANRIRRTLIWINPRCEILFRLRPTLSVTGNKFLNGQCWSVFRCPAALPCKGNGSSTEVLQLDARWLVSCTRPLRKIINIDPDQATTASNCFEVMEAYPVSRCARCFAPPADTEVVVRPFDMKGKTVRSSKIRYRSEPVR